MFAVIRTGGKQYRVAAEDVISVEKLPGSAGERVTFDEVLMVGDGDTATIGAPLVDGATVAGEVVDQTRARKILVFKKKRRKGYRRTQGHRQQLTTVKITEILAGGAKPAAKRSKAKSAEPGAEAGPDEAPAAAPETTEAQAATAKKKAGPKAKTASAKAEDTEPAAGTDAAKDTQGD